MLNLCMFLNMLYLVKIVAEIFAGIKIILFLWIIFIKLLCYASLF
jgi:hypothetical protein